MDVMRLLLLTWFNFNPTLFWRHNRRDGVSNHKPHHCLVNRLFRYRSKETSKLRDTGLCARNSPVTGEVPSQIDSNAYNASIWYDNVIMIMESNHSPVNCKVKLVIHSQTSNGCTFEVWEMINNFIPRYIMDVVTYSWWDLSYSLLLKRGPWSSWNHYPTGSFNLRHNLALNMKILQLHCSKRYPGQWLSHSLWCMMCVNSDKLCIHPYTKLQPNGTWRVT